MANKHQNRTFETRLLFVRNIFANKYDNETILASSINHKLEETFLQYKADVNQSALNIKYEADPIKMLKKLNKD